MKKVNAISGFAEWLPQHKRVEQQLMRDLALHFESYGYTPIETRSVESIDTLVAKGEVEKEIYTLGRLQADPKESKDAKLGLHFDLTVPLARYVVEYEHALMFPFKRYQMQRVWRGERPQEGRFREFYQVDIDILAEESLPQSAAIEVAEVMLGAFQVAPLPPITLHVSSRLVMDGVADCLGVSDRGALFAAIDKLPKIGAEKTRVLLTTRAGLTEEQALLVLAIASEKTTDSDVLKVLPESVKHHPSVVAGAEALSQLVKGLTARGHTNLMVDFGIVRGLDYYTGFVMESFVVGHPEMGSVCSGGAYDNLTAQMGRKQKMPGIGLSIGLTRILSYLFKKTDGPTLSISPAQVLVAVARPDLFEQASQAAAVLRARKIPTEIFHGEAKMGKQIRYAERRHIPYVLFDTDGNYEQPQIRDLARGEQIAISLAAWVPGDERAAGLVS